MRRVLILACLVAGAMVSCCKEGTGRAETGPAFVFCEDTTVMNVPNVFTPDGDGINEWFGPWGTQYSNFSFQVLAEDGHEVFFRTYLDHWDGADPRAGSTIPVTGRYFYRLRFTTANGTPIDVTNAFYLVRDRSYPCFRSETMLVFGDQFDPRRCGIIYPTNDRVCVE